MSKLLRSILAVQSVPILLFGFRALLDPVGSAATGELMAGTPATALHVNGLTSLTLGAIQLAVAIQGPRTVLRTVFGAMVPTKALAAVYFHADGASGVAVWEGMTGLLYAFVVLAGW